jgi:16S rRNA C1402 (ribose-2'-O) methylase RsmI
MDEQGGGASRSTDPAAGTSAATDVSLREHVTMMVQNLQERCDERFRAMQRATDIAFEANERRLDAVNEFRAQLGDQTRTFVTREVMDAHVSRLQGEIERVRSDLEALQKKLG